MNYKKNDSITITIEDMGHGGEGIGKIDGFPFFVKDAVIGDTIEAKVIKAKKNYAYARMIKTPSAVAPQGRTQMPLCPPVRGMPDSGPLL